jgi:hypothetical protein
MLDPDFAAALEMLQLMRDCAVNMAALCRFPTHERIVSLSNQAV